MTSPRRRAALLASSLLLGLLAAAGRRRRGRKTAATKHPRDQDADEDAHQGSHGDDRPDATTKVIEPTPTLAPPARRGQGGQVDELLPVQRRLVERCGPSFDATKIDADLAKAQALGATNVRAIIFPNDLRLPDAEGRRTPTKLSTFVTLAAAHDMTVKFTLFDWWDGYCGRRRQHDLGQRGAQAVQGRQRGSSRSR